MSQVEQAVANYLAVSGPIEEMFQAMSPRRAEEKWREEGPFKGAGSCKRVGKTLSEFGLEDSQARDEFIRLREERNGQIPNVVAHISRCPYHRADSGCVLGDLKGPACLSLIDNPAELNTRFGIDGMALQTQLAEMVKTVLTHPDPTDPSLRSFISRAQSIIQDVTENIRRFPVIEQKDQSA